MIDISPRLLDEVTEQRMCLETRLPLSQLPRDGDRRAHLNKSASLRGHHASSPISPTGSPQWNTGAFRCLQEWACVPLSGRHLCRQERMVWAAGRARRMGGSQGDRWAASRTELAAILVFLSPPSSLLCLICLLFFVLMVRGVHMLFDLLENRST